MLKQSLLVAFLTTFCSFFNTESLFAQLSWRKIGDLQQSRYLFGALPISERQILVMGGYADRITAQCELIDIEERRITAAPPMNVARAESVFLLTRDSNIVAVSGLTSMDGGVTPLCERYDRTRRTWTVLGRLLTGRRQHAACFLNDDEILVVGGRNENIVTLRSAEIFNIRTGQSRTIADFPVLMNFGYASISSQNKPIILAGRTGGANSPRSPEVYEYNASQNSWISVSSIQEGVAAPGFVRLYDKRVMVAGGTRNESPPNFSNRAFLEAYPTFQAMSPLSVERHWCAIAQWNADTVMVLGGYDINDRTMPSTEWISLPSARTSAAPAMMAGHSQFVALGMPLFNAQGQQTKARIVAISGRSDNAFATPMVEILEADVPPPLPPFPLITTELAETNDCTVFRLTVRASSLSGAAAIIKNIDLGTSANVRLEIRTALPATSVEVFVRLLSPFALPSLTSLRITDEFNRTALIPVRTPFPVRMNTTLRITSDLARLFGDSVQTFTCASVRLRNTSSSEVVIPRLGLDRNIEFSAPSAQFPLRIPAGGEAALTVCYAPSALGQQRDTITIVQECTVLRIPLVARGAGQIFQGISNCNTTIRLQTVLPAASANNGVITQAPTAQLPFPQPTDDCVSIPFDMLTAAADAVPPPSIALYNASGLCVGRFDAEEWHFDTEKAGIKRFAGIVRVNVRALPNGLYRLVLTNLEGLHTTVPIVKTSP